VKDSLTKFLVGTVDDIPERLGKTIRIGDMEVAMFRLANGTIRAIENRCPHKGGVLTEGIVSGNFVFCPLHDWKICLDNGKVQEPDTGCVKTYRTIIEEETLFLILEDN
jgi:nitrite reductase (NADH) small subunit